MEKETQSQGLWPLLAKIAILIGILTPIVAISLTCLPVLVGMKINKLLAIYLLNITWLILILIPYCVYLLNKIKTNKSATPAGQKEKEIAHKESIMKNRTLLENQLLFEFISHQNKMIYVSSEDEAPQTLEKSGIVYLKDGLLKGEKQCFIYDWGWEYLQGHKEDYAKYNRRNRNKVKKNSKEQNSN